jgi:glyoxylase-like metal-dependent hydrolase (beta-lactamase superfamily II)
MKLTAAHCGFVRMDAGFVADGTPTGVPTLLPVTCFFVETPDALIVWDTGMSGAVIEDAAGHWGRRMVEDRVAPVLEEHQLVTSRLGDAGYSTDDVTLLVNSHLHQDHSGQNSSFPAARTLARRREYEHARAVASRGGPGFIWADIGQDGEPAFIEHDGDEPLAEGGDLTLLSTPGHSPGHQSMRVRFPSGQTFVLAGDVAYVQDRNGVLSPPVKDLNFDDDAAHRSAERITAEGAAGATVLLTHDVKRWSEVDDVVTVHEE